jgi:alkanesulfonate monooxygenase SsuD/methylene tetrahydromethanopterin reductase-like flavin-dependent oxidoreductase (luciferase family)
MSAARHARCAKAPPSCAVSAAPGASVRVLHLSAALELVDHSAGLSSEDLVMSRDRELKLGFILHGVLRAARDRITLRQDALRCATPRSDFVGTPERVADALAAWFEGGAADGFATFESLPGQLELLVETVVPILQQRGLVREDYTSSTFRGNLGLEAPPNRYTLARSTRGTESGGAGGAAADFKAA